MTYYTLAEAKRDHPKWFEKGAMQFFNTRLDREFHAGDVALYLTYSNQFEEGSPKHWMITRFDSERSTLIGGVDGVDTQHKARVIAEGLAAREKGGLIRERVDGRTRFIPCPRCENRGSHGWATWEQRYPMHPSHSVEQWIDVCSEHIVEAANVLGVVA